MKYILRRSMVLGLSITGAIVGVGFASGKEVVSFFARYGIYSLLFCLFTGIMFSMFIYIILLSHSDYIKCNKNSHKNKKRKNIINIVKYDKSMPIGEDKSDKVKLFNIILFICQVSICSAMFAGIGSIFENLGINYYLCCLVKLGILFICFLYLKSHRAGVYLINFVLSISIILIILILLIGNLFKCSYSFYNISSFNNALLYMPLLYVGMNVLTVYPLLIETGERLRSRAEGIMISVFVGLFIFISLFVVCLLIILFGSNYIYSDMVMIDIANNLSRIFGSLYLIVVVFSIVTTLISTGYGASKFLKNKIGYSYSLLLSLVSAFVLSFVGFSKIIDYLYPALGAICLVVIILNIIKEKIHTR